MSPDRDPVHDEDSALMDEVAPVDQFLEDEAPAAGPPSSPASPASPPSSWPPSPSPAGGAATGRG